MGCTSSRTLASQVPLLPRTNRSGTRWQTSSPRQYLASSFGPLRRGSPRKRRTRHCCELCEHLFSGEGFSFFCSCSNQSMIWPHPSSYFSRMSAFAAHPVHIENIFAPSWCVIGQLGLDYTIGGCTILCLSMICTDIYASRIYGAWRPI